MGKDPKSSPKLTRPWVPAEQPNPIADLAKAFKGPVTDAATGTTRSVAAAPAAGEVTNGKKGKRAARIK